MGAEFSIDDFRDSLDPSKNGVADAFNPDLNGYNEAMNPDLNGYSAAMDPARNGVNEAWENYQEGTLDLLGGVLDAGTGAVGDLFGGIFGDGSTFIIIGGILVVGYVVYNNRDQIKEGVMRMRKMK